MCMEANNIDDEVLYTVIFFLSNNLGICDLFSHLLTHKKKRFLFCFCLLCATEYDRLKPRPTFQNVL